MHAKIDPKVVMDLSMLKNWWMEHFTAQQPKFIRWIDFWAWTVVIVRISKQGSSLCETTFGTTLYGFQINIWRNWCHFVQVHVMMKCDSTLLLVIGFTNIMEEKQRGENSAICNQNPMNMCVKTNGFYSQTVGEPKKKKALEGYFDEHGHQVWEWDYGWTLKCRTRCWTHIRTKRLQRFWTISVINSTRMITRMQLKKLQAQLPQFLIEYDQVLKAGRGFWDDVNGGYWPEDHVLAARRENTALVHSEGVLRNRFNAER